MTIKIAKRWVIEGGGLKTPWVLGRVVEAENSVFLDLQTADCNLASFCSAGSMPFLNILRQLMNTAVDNLVLAQMRTDDPLGKYHSIPEGCRARVMACATMPKTAVIELPEVKFNDEVASECAMTVLVENAQLNCVAMELTSANMHYVRVATLAIAADEIDEEYFDSSAPTRKRPVQEHRVTQSKYVRVEAKGGVHQADHLPLDSRRRGAE